MNRYCTKHLTVNDWFILAVLLKFEARVNGSYAKGQILVRHARESRAAQHVGKHLLLREFAGVG